MSTKTRFALRIAAFVCFSIQFTGVLCAQSIADGMVTYLSSALGTRVGGGRSYHMASEALRIGGGEFVPSDLGTNSPSSADRVWGTLVTVISCTNNSWSDSSPSNTCQPGDVIQFSSSTFPTCIYPETFTAVVASVNQSGRPSSVFQQNFQGNQVVQQAAIDTTTLTDGWLRIYRPLQRIDRFNEWKFTIVNNSATTQTYQIMVGIDIDSTVTLRPANNPGSYYIHAVTTDGTVPNFLLSDQTSFFVETPKGNEIYDSSNGLAIRQLKQ